VLAHKGTFPNKCTIFTHEKSGKNLLFYNIILTQNHAWHIPKEIEITINISNN
jgi:hypothetical protein